MLPGENGAECRPVNKRTTRPKQFCNINLTFTISAITEYDGYVYMCVTGRSSS